MKEKFRAQRRQAKGRQKGRGNYDVGLNVFLLIYVRNDPYKSMQKDAVCHLHAGSVRCISNKEVEGKPWPNEEKEDNLSESSPPPQPFPPSKKK